MRGSPEICPRPGLEPFWGDPRAPHCRRQSELSGWPPQALPPHSPCDRCPGGRRGQPGVTAAPRPSGLRDSGSLGRGPEGPESWSLTLTLILSCWLSLRPYTSTCPVPGALSPLHLACPLSPAGGTCAQEQLVEAPAELEGDRPFRQAGDEPLEAALSKPKPLAAVLRQVLHLLQSAQDLSGRHHREEVTTEAKPHAAPWASGSGHSRRDTRVRWAGRTLQTCLGSWGSDHSRTSSASSTSRFPGSSRKPATSSWADEPCSSASSRFRAPSTWRTQRLTLGWASPRGPHPGLS